VYTPPTRQNTFVVSASAVCIGHESVVDCTDDLANEDDDEDDDDENEMGWTPEDEEEFNTELDKDGDGKLNRNEIYDWLVPKDFDHIVDESNHLFDEADEDKVCLFCLFFF